jgi:hypothetical protein
VRERLNVTPFREARASSFGRRLIGERISTRHQQKIIVVLDPIDSDFALCLWASVRDDEVVLNRKEPQTLQGCAAHIQSPTRLRHNWADPGPGFSWPESYHVTILPGFNKFVLTSSRDGDAVWRCAGHAIGVADGSLSPTEVAKETLRRWRLSRPGVPTRREQNHGASECRNLKRSDQVKGFVVFQRSNLEPSSPSVRNGSVLLKKPTSCSKSQYENRRNAKDEWIFARGSLQLNQNCIFRKAKNPFQHRSSTPYRDRGRNASPKRTMVTVYVMGVQLPLACVPGKHDRDAAQGLSD